MAKRVLASAVGASALSLLQKLEVTSAKAGEGCPHLGYAPLGNHRHQVPGWEAQPRPSQGRRHGLRISPIFWAQLPFPSPLSAIYLLSHEKLMPFLGPVTSEIGLTLM